jgi:hypothetical protein
MSERSRTWSGGLAAMLAAAMIALSAYYLSAANDASPPKAPKSGNWETLVYVRLYEPEPLPISHRWFTVPGSKEKFCGIADGADFSAPIPCTAEDLRADAQQKS